MKLPSKVKCQSHFCKTFFLIVVPEKSDWCVFCNLWWSFWLNFLHSSPIVPYFLYLLFFIHQNLIHIFIKNRFADLLEMPMISCFNFIVWKIGGHPLLFYSIFFPSLIFLINQILRILRQELGEDCANKRLQHICKNWV